MEARHASWLGKPSTMNQQACAILAEHIKQSMILTHGLCDKPAWHLIIVQCCRDLSGAEGAAATLGTFSILYSYMLRIRARFLHTVH